MTDKNKKPTIDKRIENSKNDRPKPNHQKGLSDIGDIIKK
jgi:hypothetical protein